MSDLRTSFRWHLRNMPKYRHGFGDGLADAPRAVFAVAMARRDVAANIVRYPAPVKPFPAFGACGENGCRWAEKPENTGLRLVGRVEADCGGRNGIWDRRESSGWYADECQDNLCYGLVYQLPGRNGESRFVAGYAFNEDCGVTLDLSRVYCEAAAWWEPVRKSATGYPMGGYWTYESNPRDMGAARDAAHAADSMAMRAAESERAYQAAWRAGTEWAACAEDLAAARAETREILAERRALKGTQGYPALCGAITARVRDLLSDMSECNNRRDELARGEHGELYFWPGDKRLAAAFNDGAGEPVLPA